MKAKHFLWHRFYDNDGERRYIIQRITWSKIHKAFLRLDAHSHPSFYVYFQDYPETRSGLFVIGGAGTYSITLQKQKKSGTQEIVEYIDVEIVQKPPQERKLYSVGKGYHNYEIDEMFMLKNDNAALELIRHVTHTGTWHSDYPYRKRTIKGRT